MLATFTFPNQILFGDGARRSLAATLRDLGIGRPLIVTDRGLVEVGIAAEVLNGIESSVVFDHVHANPTEDDVLAGLRLYRENRCDGVVGLGGGSPIDAAKAIRLLATHPGRLADYDLTTGGREKITADLPPMVAIPTTAGTGTEAGRGTLIQLPQTGRKTIALSPHLLPTAVICDPELTLGLPPVLTAGTGMDAMTHCIESYLATTYHPICDGIALEGLRHIARGLETSVRDGANRKSRSDCMMGALMGGISFHKGLGVVHSLSHALGAQGRVHHGTLNAILLPHALRFNRDAAEARMVDVASTLGLGRNGEAASHLIIMTELLLNRLPLAKRLGDLEGLDRALIPEYSRLASLDHCHQTNPKPCTVGDFEALLDQAW